MNPRDPKPIRKQRRERDSSKPQQMIPFDRCDGCNRDSPTTVCGICLGCAQGVLDVRRKLFSRSDGNEYMARHFGRRAQFAEKVVA